MEEPLDQIECDWTGNMNMNVAITNYIQFEMKTPPGVRHNKEDSQRIFEELNSTEEGYFYYSHLCIGIISYVLYSSTEVTEITRKQVVEKLSKTEMMAWIKHGFLKSKL